ncbi:MAG TPA: 30S ribosomal protein S17 [Turneriella sp.]|nr:30S ribosomal protein S17 [Turneriella sp.]
MSEVKKSKKLIQGVVVSAKTPKTIVVSIAFRKQDTRFKKTIRLTKNLMAHDEKGEAREGDTVIVEESKPFSKQKKFALAQIVTRKRDGAALVG